MRSKYLTVILVLSFLLISCRDDIVEFSEIKKDSGSIYLNSVPQGAEIFVRDMRTNLNTPKNFPELDPGEYYFTLKLVGYKDTTVVATVESGKNNLLSIFLKREIPK